MSIEHEPKPTSRDTAPLPAPPALAGSSPAGMLSAELSATDTTEAEEAPRSGFNSRKTAATAAAVRGEASPTPCKASVTETMEGAVWRHSAMRDTGLAEADSAALQKLLDICAPQMWCASALVAPLHLLPQRRQHLYHHRTTAAGLSPPPTCNFAACRQPSDAHWGLSPAANDMALSGSKGCTVWGSHLLADIGWLLCHRPASSAAPNFIRRGALSKWWK